VRAASRTGSTYLEYRQVSRYCTREYACRRIGSVVPPVVSGRRTRRTWARTRQGIWRLFIEQHAWASMPRLATVARGSDRAWDERKDTLFLIVCVVYSIVSVDKILTRLSESSVLSDLQRRERMERLRSN